MHHRHPHRRPLSRGVTRRAHLHTARELGGGSVVMPPAFIRTPTPWPSTLFFSRLPGFWPFRASYLLYSMNPPVPPTQLYPVPDFTEPFLRVHFHLHFNLSSPMATQDRPTGHPRLLARAISRASPISNSANSAEIISAPELPRPVAHFPRFDFKPTSRRGRDASNTTLAPLPVALASEILQDFKPEPPRRWGHSRRPRAQLLTQQERAS